MSSIETLTQLVSRIPDGAIVGVPPEYSYVPMEMVRNITIKKIRDLEVICAPIGGLAVDILIGAGCVKVLEAAAVSLGEAGQAPQFTKAIQEGRIEIRDSTCPAIHTGLQASEKGVPFIPLRGLIGSDILAHRSDWRVIDDPLNEGRGPIVLIPAIKLDFALLHSPLGDRYGNVWIGKRRELMTLSHAARETLVTVEQITDDNLLTDEVMSAGTLSNLYISALAEVPGGAKPLSLPGHYDCELEVIAKYANSAKTETGFTEFMCRNTS